MNNFKPFNILTINPMAKQQAAKEYNVVNGKVTSTVRASVSAGTWQQDTVTSFADLLDKVTNRVVCSGAFSDEVQSIWDAEAPLNFRAMASDLSTNRLARRASEKLIVYPETSGFFLVDYDGDESLTPLEIHNRLCSVCPVFQDAGYVATPSSSAGIHNPDGTKQGSDGWHLYYVIDNLSLTKAFTKELSKAAWANGLGDIKVSSAGSFLTRNQIFDTSATDCARFCFETTPKVFDGITRTPPEAFIVDGVMLDGSFQAPITDAEFELMKSKAKEALGGVAATVKADWLANKVEEYIAKGMSAEDAQSTVNKLRSNVESGQVTEDLLVTIKTLSAPVLFKAGLSVGLTLPIGELLKLAGDYQDKITCFDSIHGVADNLEVFPNTRSIRTYKYSGGKNWHILSEERVQKREALVAHLAKKPEIDVKKWPNPAFIAFPRINSTPINAVFGQIEEKVVSAPVLAVANSTIVFDDYLTLLRSIDVTKLGNIIPSTKIDYRFKLLAALKQTINDTAEIEMLLAFWSELSDGNCQIMGNTLRTIARRDDTESGFGLSDIHSIVNDIGSPTAVRGKGRLSDFNINITAFDALNRTDKRRVVIGLIQYALLTGNSNTVIDLAYLLVGYSGENLIPCKNPPALIADGIIDTIIVTFARATELAVGCDKWLNGGQDAPVFMATGKGDDKPTTMFMDALNAILTESLVTGERVISTDMNGGHEVETGVQHRKTTVKLPLGLSDTINDLREAAIYYLSLTAENRRREAMAAVRITPTSFTETDYDPNHFMVGNYPERAFYTIDYSAPRRTTMELIERDVLSAKRNCYLQAGLGWGKTFHIARPLIKRILQQGGCVVVISPLQKLVAQCFELMDFSKDATPFAEYQNIHYTDKVKLSDISDPAVLSVCVNSIAKFDIKQFIRKNADLVVIDEVVQVLDVPHGSHVSSDISREINKAHLVEFIKEVITDKPTLMMDANLSNRDIEFIQNTKLLGIKKPVTAIRVKPIEQERTFHITEDEASFMTAVTSAIEAGENIAIGHDNVRRVVRMINEIYKRLKNTDKAFSIENDVIHLYAANNAELRASSGDEVLLGGNPTETTRDCRVFTFSPVAKSGISINSVEDKPNHFDKVFCYFTGTSSATDCIQMTGRVRYVKDVYVYLGSNEPNIVIGSSVAAVESELAIKAEQALASGICVNHTTTDVALEYRKRSAQAGYHYLANRFVQIAVEHGYQITVMGDTEEDTAIQSALTAMGAGNRAIRQERARLICKSAPFTKDEWLWVKEVITHYSNQNSTRVSQLFEEHGVECAGWSAMRQLIITDFLPRSIKARCLLQLGRELDADLADNEYRALTGGDLIKRLRNLSFVLYPELAIKDGITRDAKKSLIGMEFVGEKLSIIREVVKRMGGLHVVFDNKMQDEWEVGVEAVYDYLSKGDLDTDAGQKAFRQRVINCGLMDSRWLKKPSGKQQGAFVSKFFVNCGIPMRKAKDRKRSYGVEFDKLADMLGWAQQRCVAYNEDQDIPTGMRELQLLLTDIGESTQAINASSASTRTKRRHANDLMEQNSGRFKVLALDIEHNLATLMVEDTPKRTLIELNTAASGDDASLVLEVYNGLAETEKPVGRTIVMYFNGRNPNKAIRL